MSEAAQLLDVAGCSAVEVGVGCWAAGCEAYVTFSLGISNGNEMSM